jgi:hypothetical protein
MAKIVSGRRRNDAICALQAMQGYEGEQPHGYASQAGKQRRERQSDAGSLIHRIKIQDFRICGAQERTRTFTAVKPLAPEASASTNSATWAQVAG